MSQTKLKRASVLFRVRAQIYFYSFSSSSPPLVQFNDIKLFWKPEVAAHEQTSLALTMPVNDLNCSLSLVQCFVFSSFGSGYLKKESTKKGEVHTVYQLGGSRHVSMNLPQRWEYSRTPDLVAAGWRRTPERRLAWPQSPCSSQQ